MTTVGEALIALRPDTKGFAGAAERKMAGPLNMVGGVAKKAMLGVGAAIAGAAVKGVMSFSDFQGGMNEVFTLLPGISDDAMGKMTGQVKQFSKDFGVLPKEVVPSLYQALSAGVPPDNVFSFLETSQKAAKGGVTDLTTAVDGISSVVNAYGEDVLDATKASDLMFTAVKLGKTNFGELSKSIFNVTPVASALGVKFEDVSAGLAAITAKGVPTSVATTQMRQLFNELSKAGGETADTFEEIAGKSFKDFVAEGGNTQDALQLLEKHAEETGVGVNDLFGSVEAGAAALALTGSGTETFSKNLKEMEGATGATEAAFDTMSKGLGPVFAKIKAGLDVFFIDIGEKLAPVVEKAARGILRAFETVGPLVGAVFRGLGIAAKVVGPAFKVAGSAVSFLMGKLDNPVVRVVAGLITAVFIPGLIAMGAHATASAAKVVAGWVAQGAAATVAAAKSSLAHVANVAGYARSGAAAVAGAAKIVAGWVAQGAAAVAGAASAAVGFAAQAAGWAMAGVQALAGAAKIALAWLIAIGPIALVIAAVVGLVVLIVKNFDAIKAFIAKAWEFVKAVTAAVWNGIKAAITFVINAIVAYVRTYFNIIRTVIQAVWNGVRAGVSAAWNFVRSAISGAVNAVVGAVRSMASGVGNAIGNVIGWFRGLPGRILAAISSLGSTLYNAAVNMVSGFIRGLAGAGGRIISTIRSQITNRIPGFIKSALGIRSPSTVMAKLGRQTGEGMAVGIASARGAVRSAMDDLVNLPNLDDAGNLRVIGPTAPGGRRPTFGGPARGTSDPLVAELVALRAAMRADAEELRRELAAIARTARPIEQTFNTPISPRRVIEEIGREL